MENYKFKNFINGAKNVLFPVNLTCEVCGKDVFENERFCPDCLKTLPFNDKYICLKCGRAIQENYPVCLQCKSNMPIYSAARSAFLYEGDIIKLIRKFKTGAKYLADLFSEYLEKTFIEYYGGADYILSVPMTDSAIKKRGYNQAALLAQKLSEKVNVEYRKDALVKTRSTADQKFLNVNERAENLLGSFRVHERKELNGKTVVLVDDVLTTGATANAVAKALFSAKVQRVLVLTVASVRHKEEN